MYYAWIWYETDSYSLRFNYIFHDFSLEPVYQSMLLPHVKQLEALAKEQEDPTNEHANQAIREQLQEFVEIGEFTADLYKRAYHGVE